MSNEMIVVTYKLAVIAMVEGAVLLWLGLIYGFWIMVAGTIWQQLIELANEEEEDEEKRKIVAPGKADTKAKNTDAEKRTYMGELECCRRLPGTHSSSKQKVG